MSLPHFAFFADPLYLLLLLPLIPWLIWQRRRRKPRLPFPSLGSLLPLSRSRFAWVSRAGIAARCLALVALVLALARPQGEEARKPKSSEGLDIVLIIDTSRSMEARDFILNGKRPSRLTVVKQVIANFVEARPNDRIGMVVFGTEAFTQAPLTLDHDVLQRFLERVQIGMAGDATAIGDGLVTAVKRLKDIDAKSKVAILLTDGGNTAGRADPMAATAAAKAMGVKVYTVGVGGAETAVDSGGARPPQKADFDSDLLKKVADATGGKFFSAGDTESLVKVYETIDQLEKTKIQVESFEQHDDRYVVYVWVAAFALMGEMAFALTRFRSIPA